MGPNHVWYALPIQLRPLSKIFFTFHLLKPFQTFLYIKEVLVNVNFRLLFAGPLVCSGFSSLAGFIFGFLFFLVWVCGLSIEAGFDFAWLTSCWFLWIGLFLWSVWFRWFFSLSYIYHRSRLFNLFRSWWLITFNSFLLFKFLMDLLSNIGYHFIYVFILILILFFSLLFRLSRWVIFSNFVSMKTWWPIHIEFFHSWLLWFAVWIHIRSGRGAFHVWLWFTL